MFVALVALAVVILSTILMQRFIGQVVQTRDQRQLAMLNRIGELEWLLEDEVETRLDLQELLESGIVFSSVRQEFSRAYDASSVNGGSTVQLNQRQVDSISAVIVGSEASERPGSQSVRAQREGQRAERLQPDYKQQQLVKSRLAEDEAAWIVQRESEIQLSSLYDNYNQRRLESQQSLADNDNGVAPELSSSQQVRVEMGDEYYDRYLEAQGLLIAVTVGSIMSSSPDESAGFLSDDTIVHGFLVCNM